MRVRPLPPGLLNAAQAGVVPETRYGLDVHDRPEGVSANAREV